METIWRANREKRRAEESGKISERNDLIHLLRETHRALREPAAMQLNHILLTYGFGNLKGSVARRLQTLATQRLCGGALVQTVENEIQRRTSANESHSLKSVCTWIAAKEGVVAHSLDAAAKRVYRAYRALKRSKLTADGNTNWSLLVGDAPELDDLLALQREIQDTAQRGLREVRSKGKLNSQNESHMFELLGNRARAVQSKVPRQVTVKNIRWVADNRAARLAIANGRMILLCRSVAREGIRSVEIMRWT
jgi:hypothetical protein